MKLKSMVLSIIVASIPFGPKPPFAQPYEPRMEPGVDRLGGDFSNTDLQSADPRLCRSACEGDTRCRAWTYVKPGQQGSNARCWLKTVVPRPTSDPCCTSGMFNVLKEIQACLYYPRDHRTPPPCMEPGGRDYGKAGKTFKKGDTVIIATKFDRLHPGNKTITAIYSHQEGGKFVNFSGGKKTIEFNNTSETYEHRFPAHFTKEGRWHVNLAIAGEGLSGQVVGSVEYCIDCPLE
jgi:hypothetical protein